MNMVRDAANEAAPLPPQSPEAEQSVLGALLMDNAGWDRVADVLREGDFYTNDHRLIFAAIAHLIGASQPADVLTVCDRLRALGKLEDAGGAQYVGELALHTPSAANVRRYAEIVAERALMRRTITVGHQIVSRGYAPEGRDARALVDQAQAEVMALSEAGAGARRDFQTLAALVPEVIDYVEMKHEHYQNNRDGVTGVTTGLADLDRQIDGFHEGELIILAARPSMGKSALALGIAKAAAEATNRWGLFFGLEMGNREQGLRLLAAAAKVPVQRLLTGRVYDPEWGRVAEAPGKLENVKLAFNEYPGLSVMDLRTLARRAVRELGPLSVIVVDYLQLMSYSGSDPNRANQLGEISRGMKLLARELKVPIVALAQLNRELEKRVNKRPMMSDLRDSGALEQDADVILFIYRDEVYHANSIDAGVAEILVAKQRNGPVGVVKVHFSGEHTRFENLERDA